MICCSHTKCRSVWNYDQTSPYANTMSRPSVVGNQEVHFALREPTIFGGGQYGQI